MSAHAPAAVEHPAALSQTAAQHPPAVHDVAAEVHTQPPQKPPLQAPVHVAGKLLKVKPVQLSAGQVEDPQAVPLARGDHEVPLVEELHC